MRILIIGNGFDLNLGLKTSYKDFIHSKYFEILVAKKNSMALYFYKKQKLNNWVDIEREITNFSNSVNETNLDIKKDFMELKIALMNYLEEAQSKEINKKSKAFEMLQKEINKIDLIFNFNYTNSIFRIADILEINNIEKKHCYIHGSIEDKDIVFGVEDKAKVKQNHKFFKKSYNLHHGKYKIKQYFNEENEVIIFGHSLGITDSTYFQDYINKRSMRTLIEYSNLVFYYYGELGWDEMYAIIDDYTYNNFTEFRANSFVFIDSSL